MTYILISRLLIIVSLILRATRVIKQIDIFSVQANIGGILEAKAILK